MVSRLADVRVADLPTAVVVVRPDGRLEDANSAACELLGEDRDHLLGGALPAAIATAVSGSPQRGALVQIQRRDGSVVWVQVDAERAPAAEGSVVVATLTDVTALVGEMAPAAPDYAARGLADMTQQMANARLGPEAVLATVTSGLSRIRPGTWVASLIDKDPRVVRVIAANDADPLLAKYVEEMHGSGEASASTIAMQVIESGQPVVIPKIPIAAFMEMLRTDVRDYMARNSLPVQEPAETIGALVVPMRARGATVGALGVYEGASVNSLTQNDVAWVQAIADRAGLAAENAQLYSDAVHRLERLTAVRNIGLAVSSSQNLRLTLQMILDQLLVGLHVDAADLFLLDEGEGMLVMAAQAGFQSTSIPEYKLPVDERLPGRLVSRPHVESVIEGSALAQFRRRTLFAREGFRSYCAAPLVARNRTIGVLEVFTRATLHADEEWFSFLEALAALAAVAIDGAHMAERLEKVPASPRRQTAAAPRLNPLERQILSLVVEGTTNADIAKVVHLSQSTVKFHVRQILQRVGASNRTELARKATREGWL
jgi:GAF domain-containing protein